ncbi:putative transmembrane protein 244 isoform X1 [Pelodiscus sinensis]|uniref:Transmembrane protein 244 n=1 Tax=Pelodiscus sinensis TaxID=13735 RepID=K7FW59_PELSI|nr:transmembrane protein 244 isoform X2 [Pelodiscus sinensis]XP_025043616.1 transmembrane protein 244 isoform X2 [Pelodiscus sinensis]|eukprot:XP_006112078.1 transmembrane protein 244 isoform X2 [Pelodiscus sinensis]
MAPQSCSGSGIKTILIHLLLCLVTFYTVYYMIGSICSGAFRLDTFDGLIPFEFNTEPSHSNPKYLVNLLSMELTYFASSLLFAILLKRWLWDYAITVTLVHVALTSVVMKQFPLVWHWWLALGSGLFIMICNGHLVTHFACSDSSNLTLDSY